MTADGKQEAPAPAQAGTPAPSDTLMRTTLVGRDTPGDSPPSTTPAPAAPAAPLVGKTLGKHLVTSQLGEGGMGVVFKGYDRLIDREVAIKVLADHLANNLTALGRFLSEARAVGKLTHPNVVALYEVCQE